MEETAACATVSPTIGRTSGLLAQGQKSKVIETKQGLALFHSVLSFTLHSLQFSIHVVPDKSTGENDIIRLPSLVPAAIQRVSKTAQTVPRCLAIVLPNGADWLKLILQSENIIINITDPDVQSTIRVISERNMFCQDTIQAKKYLHITTSTFSI